MSIISVAGTRSAISMLVKAGALLSLLVLGACGTTSKLERPAGHTGAGAGAPNLSVFEKVYVQDFSSTYTDKKHDRAKMKAVGKDFADQISTEVKATGAFTSVRRVGLDTNVASLARKETVPVALVSGTITRFDDGNAFARAMIGMGAGSSYFEADVVVTDAKTGTKLGTIKADKNSWVLGGMIAATQTAKSYMPGVASKIAAELMADKTGK